MKEFIQILIFIKIHCGERGIRTLEELSPLSPFQGGTFNHSATSP